MHPTSSAIIGQILRPTGGDPAPYSASTSTSMTIEQIVSPTGVYSGEERRPRGTLVAEVVLPSPAREQTPQGI